MENASKALLLAAGVLISVIVISLLVITFVSFRSISDEYNSKLDTQELTEFNIQFTKYSGKNIEVQDVMSIANLAADWNNTGTNEIITVEYNSKDMVVLDENGKYKNTQFDQLFKQHNSNIKNVPGTTKVQVPLYKINKVNYYNTGRVKDISVINSSEYKIYDN